MVTQMAWETAKVSRPSSLLSFLLYSIPPLHTPSFLSSLLTQSPSSSLCPPFPSSLLTPFSPPVCSALTILSFSLFHPSVPFGSHPLLSFSRCFSGPPVNRVLCPVGHRPGSFLQIATKTQHKHSATHRERILLMSSDRAHFESQNKTELTTQSSEVLNGLFHSVTQRMAHMDNVYLIFSCPE